VSGKRPAWGRYAVMMGLLALGLVLVPADRAAAHPLGNFTVNRYSGLRIQADQVVVDYVVDMAEIPAFQQRQELDIDGDATVSVAEAAGWRARECPRLAAAVHARLDGRALGFTVAASAVAFPPGAGGLPTLRLQCALTAAAPNVAATRTLTYMDANFTGRVGWREITAVGDGTTLEAANVPAQSVSARLTAYPTDLLRSPLAQDRATIRFRPGGARSTDAAHPSGPHAGLIPGGVDRATAAFAALVAGRQLTPAFAVLAFALAVALGALHALAPGHGKTVMAAYLVGLRGSLRQALIIGGTVTATHTAAVLVLGIVLSLSETVAPERLYPWLGLVSGLLLVGIGVGLLRRALAGDDHPTNATPAVQPSFPSGAGSDQRHHHGHRNRPAGPPGRWGLVALGLVGGLVPSPSAVLVLLAAVALGRAWFGVLLVLAYGTGMAVTLTAVGLLLVRARGPVDRHVWSGAWAWVPRAGRLLPFATATAIVVVGLLLAARGATTL
jgi:nickel/cobalt transporter (NicO) family protein